MHRKVAAIAAGLLLSAAPPAGALTFDPLQSLPAGTAPYFIAAADVNGDGRQDLVVADHFSDASWM